MLGNSMTDSARNSNRVLMSETVMMMKEHIGDTYGPIRFTYGTGCSGGSINSNMNLSIHPGLLDGIAGVAQRQDHCAVDVFRVVGERAQVPAIAAPAARGERPDHRPADGDAGSGRGWLEPRDREVRERGHDGAAREEQAGPSGSLFVVDTIDEAVDVWLKRWHGWIQSRIAAHYDINQGRIVRNSEG